MDQFAIVGLGNPGKKFVNNRHNIGFKSVELLAEEWGIYSFSTRKTTVEYAAADIAGKKIFLAKPLTYMNNSGRAVQWLMAYYKLKPEQVLVIYDDIDLPAGQLRLRPKGSGGTHNGMRSIISHIGTHFPRLRVGINPDHPVHDLSGFVLSDFNAIEKELVFQQIERMPVIVRQWLEDGLQKTMSNCNIKY